MAQSSGIAHTCFAEDCQPAGRQAAPVSHTQIATNLQKPCGGRRRKKREKKKRLRLSASIKWEARNYTGLSRGRRRNPTRTEQLGYIDQEDALMRKTTTSEDARLNTDTTCRMFIGVLLPPGMMTYTAAACGWRGPAPGLLGGTGPLPAMFCQKEPPRRIAPCSACTALLP